MHSYSKALTLVVDQLLENASVHGYREQLEPMVTIDVTKQQDQLMLVLRDNGEGVKSELLDKLVQPFFTTKRGPQGHIGLGLYMVYNLVSRVLVGQMKLESPAQQGLSVTLTLPLKVNEKQRDL